MKIGRGRRWQTRKESEKKNKKMVSRKHTKLDDNLTKIEVVKKNEIQGRKVLINI